MGRSTMYDQDWLSAPAVWVGNLPDTPGLKLKVRGLLATGAGDEIERRGQKIPPKLRQAMGHAGLVKRLEAITVDVVVERLLVDWDELEDGDAPVVFTAETARKLLKQYSRLRAAVFAAAAKADVDILPGDTASGVA